MATYWNAPEDVKAARHLGEALFEFEFYDGLRKVVDLSQLLRGPLAEELLTTGRLGDFLVDERTATIVWWNGLDIAPETLYALPAISQPADEAR